MERSEPSLVPEWLKGASSGGAGGATHYTQTSSNHQDESGGSFPLRPRVQPHGVTAGGSHVDYDSPRFPTSSSDRAYYSAVRRGTGVGSSGVSDRSLQDRETFSRGTYSNFGRSTAYRSYDAGLDRSDRDTSRERDWDWDRDRERDGRDRSRVLGGFGVPEERDRDRSEQSDNSSAFRRPGLGLNAGPRYEADIPAPLRRVQSMGSAARALENGEKKLAELGNLPTAPPANSGSLTSSMQKAAFERNFPSLGAQERGLAVSSIQSNLGSMSGVLSPRPLWQGSTLPRMEGIRSAASSPGLPAGGSPGSGLTSTPGGSNGEGWSSALAEAPTAPNGIPAVPMTPTGSVTTPPTSSLANISLTGNLTNPPKMVETLAPPRVRTPPQYSAEKERLEERALQQSRQLIPMIPKTLGPVSRDKKGVRVDVVAPPSTMKPRQPIGTPQVSSAPYRPPASRSETLKLGQGTGKILSRKVASKEGILVSSPSPVSTGLKSEPLPVVATAVGVPGLSGGTSAAGVGVLNSTAIRKQKLLLDRRAVPIPPVSVPGISDGNAGSTRSKDSIPGTLSASDERRPSLPTQNRVDFFNALRRKAGLGTTPNIVDKLDVAPTKSNDMVNGEEVESSLPEETVHLLEDVREHPVIVSYQMENGEQQETDATLDVDVPGSSAEQVVREEKENGGILEGATDEQPFEETDGTLQQQLTLGDGPTDEEEMSFLLSLGWSQATAEEDVAITQDEIDAFLQKRNEIKPAAGQKRSSNHHHRRMDLRIGSTGSETSGVTTSDSESEDDSQVRGNR